MFCFCSIVVDSQLLTIQQFENLIGHNTDRCEWSLLFRATRDGFNSAVFHRLCDNKGPTISVARVENGPLVGGYTKISWSSSGGYRSDITAFVFSNLHNDQFTKFAVKFNAANRAVYHGSHYGLWFGNGDLILLYYGDTKDNNHSIGSNYRFSGYELIGAEQIRRDRKFSVEEIEVFAV